MQCDKCREFPKPEPCPKTFQIRILKDGTMQFINKPEAETLKKEGASSMIRASHVEPKRRVWRWLFHFVRWVSEDNVVLTAFTRCWPVTWRVNLTPSGGPIHGAFLNRSEAIDWEVEWLQQNKFGASLGGPASTRSTDSAANASSPPKKTSPPGSNSDDTPKASNAGKN